MQRTTKSYAEFGSGCQYCKYDFSSRKFCLVDLSTCIYFSVTRHFQQHGDNFNFETLTFAMVAAADELISLFVYSAAKDG